MSDQNIKLVDVHCHLDDEEFDNDLDDVIRRAKKYGVIAIVNSALGPESIEKSLQIAQKYKNYVFLSFGLEPYNLDDSDYKATLDLIKKHKDEIVAVGEVGLDYYYIRDHNERKIMEDRFREFIDLAKKINKPLVVHSRSAGKFAIRILIDEGAKQVLMHAFDGGSSWVKRGVDEGYFFSVPPSVIRSQQKKKMVRILPLENMMLETDSPVLGPEPKARNEPMNVLYSLREIASIKQISEKTVAEKTTENAIKFFNFKF